MNNKASAFIVGVIFLLFAWPVCAAENAEVVEVLPDTTVMLPADGKVVMRWVLPLQDEQKVKEGNCLSVDNSGRPWIGYGGKYIMNPRGGYMVSLSQPYKGMVHLDNGSLIFATGSDLGFIVLTDDTIVDDKGIPVVTFQPIAKLPLPDCRIFKGAGSCLYMAGRNAETGDDEVFLLKPENVTVDGGTKSLIKGYKKLLSFRMPVRAVAGDGTTTFIASGRTVFSVSGEGQGVSKLCDCPDDVSQLAYSPESGLFFSTGRNVGCIGGSGPYVFMTTQNHDMCMQRGSLYLLFKNSLGVFALDNIGEFKRYDLASMSAVDQKQKDVEVKGMRLAEAGPPDFQPKEFDTKFDRAMHYIFCRVDLGLRSHAKEPQHHPVTVSWFGPDGKEIHSDTTVFDFGPNQQSITRYFYWGSDEGWTCYPGEYTAKLLISGAVVGEKKFMLTGDATLIEAVRNKDTLTLKKLLDNGDDANARYVFGRPVLEPQALPRWSRVSTNARDGFGTPVLELAVTDGSVEDVKTLLDHGADVNARDNLGATALFYAADIKTEDGLEKAGLLIARGADVRAKDNNGESALFYLTVFDCNLDVARLLVEHGADVNEKDNRGQTPISRFNSNRPKYLKFLLENGADPNVKDDANGTALYWAVTEGQAEYVRILVEHGADLGIQYAQHSILYYALMASKAPYSQTAVEISQFLIDHNADLLPSWEEEIVLDKEICWWLDRGLIARVLDRNDSLLEKAASVDDQWIQSVVAARLLEKAITKIEKSEGGSDFVEARSILKKARAAAQKGGADVSEINRIDGLLERQLALMDAAVFSK